MGSGYLGPGLVYFSGVMVLGGLTLVYRNPDLSRKRKRVNPGNSDAEYGVRLHHEFGNGKSKRRKHKCTKSACGNRDSRSERESGCTYVCDVSVVQNTRRRTGKGNFCMCGRFSADGFRTRSTRVIRWRVLGVRATKGKTGKGRRDVQVIHGRWEKGVVCRWALCVSRAGTRGPFQRR